MLFRSVFTSIVHSFSEAAIGVLQALPPPVSSIEKQGGQLGGLNISAGCIEGSGMTEEAMRQLIADRLRACLLADSNNKGKAVADFCGPFSVSRRLIL